MKKHIHILFALLSLVCLSSCENGMDEVVQNNTPTKSGYADLRISFKAPSLTIETRGLDNINQYPNDTSKWTDWEKYCDGALFYRLTLLLIDSNGTLVGYRDLYNESLDMDDNNKFITNNTEAIAEFSSTNLKHGNIEKLKAGNYKLIAVANYSPVTSDNNTYEGLGVSNSSITSDSYNNGADGDFTALVAGTNGIITKFDEAAGISNVMTGHSIFFSYKLDAGDDRVCKPVPQPLVMIRDITLNEGDNEIEGLVSRTFARIRLEVKNESTTSGRYFDVSDLSFVDEYASRGAYLFNDVRAEANNSTNMYDNFALWDHSIYGKGNLDVASSDAIVKAGTMKDVFPGGETEVLFDCYILEGQIASSVTATYSFKVTSTTTMQDGDATGNHEIHNFSSLVSYKLYIRNGVNNETTLYRVNGDIMDTNSVTGAGNEGTGSSQFSLKPEYIWQMDLTETPGSIGNEAYYVKGTLKSLSTGLYLQANDSGDGAALKLGTSPSTLMFRINFNGEDELGTIMCGSDNTWYYVNNGKWNSTTAANALDSTTSNNNNNNGRDKHGKKDNYGFQLLTFETIDAETATRIEGTVSDVFKYSESSSTTTRKDQIVRNDFFWGIVPVKIN